MGARVVATGLQPALAPLVEALEHGAEVDVAVAGVPALPGGPVLELSQASWEALVAGVREAFFGAQREARAFRERGEGRVVFLVSTASIRPLQGAGLAATAGGFLSTIAQVGAVELGGEGVTVNVVAHGFLEGEAPRELVDGVPAGRLARADDVAAACLFLASRAAAYVNGAVLPVDGGFWITKSGGGSPLLR